MSQHERPPRVRVTGPPRRRPAPPRARAREIDSGTALGEVLMGSLLREQLVLALRLLGLVVLTFGSLPLVFHFAPSLAEVEVLRVPLAWLLLGFLAYPWLLVLGWAYVRRAEANERAFADLLDDVGHDPSEGP